MTDFTDEALDDAEYDESFFDHRYNPALFCAKCSGPCEMDPND